MDQHPAGEQLLCERGKSCLGDLFVFLGRRKARTDAADHFAVDDDRKPALHLDEAASGYRRVTTVIDCLLQRLGGLLEECGTARLARRQLDRSIAAWSMRSSRMTQPPSSTTATTPRQ